MDNNYNKIVKLCVQLGCCDACCLRYIGIRNPAAYENPHKTLLKYQDEEDCVSNGTSQHPMDTENGSINSSDIIEADKDTVKNSNETVDLEPDNANVQIKAEDSNIPTEMVRSTSNSNSPPLKRRKHNTCVSCLGILQDVTWSECLDQVKEVFDKKPYECPTFAVALSAPVATLLRERAVTLLLERSGNDYDASKVTSLKEAWKWSLGPKLAAHINKTLDSGAVSPLLVTLNFEYPDDLQELEILEKRGSRGATRRWAEDALRGGEGAVLAQWPVGPPRPASAPRACAQTAHLPIYLGGRYIKRSRTLPQTPWVVEGRRVLPSSVQEIIFEPIAAAYGMSDAEMQQRLKFMSAGREDVDVRCLGDGRPFAIEMADPLRHLSEAELTSICERISASGDVSVSQLVYVTKEDLALLKKGEETKSKTYEALCIKLEHSKYDTDVDATSPVVVTEADIDRINNYTNTDEPDARIVLLQKTPIRVLHRRPLLTRTRKILELTAHRVPEHPRLLVLRARTEAGLYVKEWAHGELGRSAPGLPAALAARVDILALDVANVHLHWPPARPDIA